MLTLICYPVKAKTKENEVFFFKRQNSWVVAFITHNNESSISPPSTENRVDRLQDLVDEPVKPTVSNGTPPKEQSPHMSGATKVTKSQYLSIRSAPSGRRDQTYNDNYK